MRKINKKKKNNNYTIIINNRFISFFVVFIILFSFIFIGLINVMIINKEKNKESLDLLTYAKVYGTSTPRGRIYDRNYNLLVDNKSLKTIVYQRKKGTSNSEMIEVANRLAPHIDIDYHRISDRSKREYFYAKNKDICDKLVTKKEIEKVKQRKMTSNELEELKLTRIDDNDLEFSEEELKVAYLFYLMNRGYTYEEKIIKSDVSDKEYAYVSENNALWKPYHPVTYMGDIIFAVSSCDTRGKNKE